ISASRSAPNLTGHEGNAGFAKSTHVHRCQAVSEAEKAHARLHNAGAGGDDEEDLGDEKSAQAGRQRGSQALELWIADLSSSWVPIAGSAPRTHMSPPFMAGRAPSADQANFLRRTPTSVHRRDPHEHRRVD